MRDQNVKLEKAKDGFSIPNKSILQQPSSISQPRPTLLLKSESYQSVPNCFRVGNAPREISTSLSLGQRKAKDTEMEHSLLQLYGYYYVLVFSSQSVLSSFSFS